MNRIHSIHFIGIKGVGMTPLAIIAKEAGLKVSGCDIDDEFITDESLKKAEIHSMVGFSKEHLVDVDLVITTGAHGGFDNPEVKIAKEQHIHVLTQGEAVGYFMKGELFRRTNMKGISIAGSHGKTTTTALLACVLTANNMDPSYIIGTGTVPSLQSPGHYGTGTYFIAEADEYATEPTYDSTPKFLWQYPFYGIITNIELDHPDIYESINEIFTAFLKFSNKISKKGALIAWGDDPQVKRLLEIYKGKVVTYGFSSQNSIRVKKIEISKEKTSFWVDAKGSSLGEFILKINGEHNALNALAVIALCLELGLNVENIKKGLLSFTGTKRRAEYKGKLVYGALLFDDYAHHPTEIKKTLQAFRQKYPTYKIVCLFQPHTYSRTKKLFNDFVHAFSQADIVGICTIYPSMRETKDSTVSSELLVQEMKEIHKNTLLFPTFSDVIEYIDKMKFDDQYIIITMGAGDIYKICDTLIS